jgi:hypothetical protein
MRFETKKYIIDLGSRDKTPVVNKDIRSVDTIYSRASRFVIDEVTLVAQGVKKYKKTSLGVGALLMYLLIYFFTTTAFVTVNIRPVLADSTNTQVLEDANFLAKNTPQFMVDSNGLVQENSPKTVQTDLFALMVKITFKVINY